MTRFESISHVMEAAFNKVLPIPKTPRVYRPPPPPKPLTWVPHGKLGNEKYEIRLVDFASEILAIDSQRTRRIKYSSRGWCYLLEGLGKIHKGEFNACQRAINDCRKMGYLPLDFVAPDQDETRRFSGILEASAPASAVEKMKSEIKDRVDNLALQTTDFWEGEKYYVMMCVEKGDIKRLFRPICQEYHVPIVSSKGWAPILLRSHIVKLSKRAQSKGLQPVLLLFYDLDPIGIKISDRFRKNLRDIQKATGWNPDSLIIERFGLNKEDIDKYDLTWIENLRTGSGRESRDDAYIRKYGRRKCESNALFKNDETLKAAEELCRKAIEKYFGSDAIGRFESKMNNSQEQFGDLYTAFEKFSGKIEDVAKTLSEEKDTVTKKLPDLKREVELVLDNKYYGRCPECGASFDYDREDDGKLVRCRSCDLPMRLRIFPEGYRS